MDGSIVDLIDRVRERKEWLTSEVRHGEDAVRRRGDPTVSEGVIVLLMLVVL